jgi:uncharacterized Fe-S center protein
LAEKAKVYFTKDISSAGLARAYEALERRLDGKVAVKLSSGEGGNNYYLNPKLIQDLVNSLNGTIVECNTAYPGSRFKTADHWQTIKAHGFLDIAPVDILDEEGDISIPIPNGKQIKEDFVGSHIARYDHCLVLSHFKGHAMGGFGGALKNISIGLASSSGKLHIHSAGKTRTDMMWALSTDQDAFVETMADAAGAVIKYFGEGERMVYINVMNNLSVDCDCDANPHEPELDDIGILSSLDPVALDKACVDLIYRSDMKKSASIRDRIEAKHGTVILNHGEKLGYGTKQYELIEL